MPSPRGSRGRTPARSRRQVSWSPGPNAVDLAFAATGSQVWTNGVQLVLEDRATIVRMRGWCHFIMKTTDSGGAGWAGAIGLGIVSAASFAAGVASVPTPVTESGWPGWLYHRFFDVRSITATIADGVNAAAVDLSWELDSKAMRKLGADEVVLGAIEVTEIGVSTAEFHADTRMLLKLS